MAFEPQPKFRDLTVRPGWLRRNRGIIRGATVNDIALVKELASTPRTHIEVDVIVLPTLSPRIALKADSPQALGTFGKELIQQSQLAQAGEVPELVKRVIARRAMVETDLRNKQMNTVSEVVRLAYS